MASADSPLSNLISSTMPGRKPFAGKRCFVVMPYGEREDIDFDTVYSNLIKPAVEALGLSCVRSDEVDRSGLIHKEMIESIMESDAVIVDITLQNPNVFYELGIRHTARRSGTVVIRQDGLRIPFNINGLRVFDYNSNTINLDVTVKALSTTIANSLAEQAVDSLVYSLTGSSMSIQRIGRPIGWYEKFLFRHASISNSQLGIVTGDICHVRDIDVWVNPENTRMQMGRIHDQSLSACVRYLGGRKNVHKRVVRDYVQNELSTKIGKDELVEAGHVVSTGSGELRRTNDVRAILHTAAMHGEPTKGYQLIRNYPSCVTNALVEMDRLNSSYIDGYRYNSYRGRLQTIVFPLLGTREQRADPQDVAFGLVLAATNYLEDHPATRIKAIYFLAYTDVDKALCENAFRRNDWDI